MFTAIARLTRAAARLPRTLEAATELPDTAPRARRDIEARVDLLLAHIARLDARVAELQEGMHEIRRSLPAGEGPLQKVKHALTGDS